VSRPRALLIDDDPMFCKQFEKHAQKSGFDLTVCKNVGDLIKLPKGREFDVAIVDYFFGELTGIQMSHLLGGEVPVVMISNSESRSIAGDGWPGFVRAFIHKSRGIEAILAEAMFTVGWPNLFPAAKIKTMTPVLPSLVPLNGFRKIAAAAVILAIAIGAMSLLLYRGSARSIFPQIFWDQGVRVLDTAKADLKGRSYENSHQG